MSDVELHDRTFELGGVTFGEAGPLLVTKFDPGTTSTRDQDTDRPQADGAQFGRDFRSPGAWTWELTVNETSDITALDRQATLAEVWTGDDHRFSPGAVVPLRYRLAGRNRRIYGRPRRFQAPIDVRHMSGAIDVTADFKRVDALHYDDIAQSVTVGLVPATVGGLRSPLKSPVTSVRRSAVARAGQFTVGGTAPTWIWVSFTGPVGAPRVVIDGSVVVELTSTLAYDDVAVIDARPWALSALRNGANVAGDMGVTRMSRMLLKPGAHEVVFTGLDTTASARATVSWRNASNSL